MDWVHAIGVFVGLAAGPTLGKYWKKLEEYDQKRIDQAYAEADAKKALKAQRKKTHYTSASVVGPLRIGHDGGGSGDSSRSSEAS